MQPVKVVALWLLVSILAGCSTAGRVDEIVPAAGEVAVVNRHNADVRINVSGGDERTVSSRTFDSALMQTLNNTRVFSAARLYGQAKYELLVVILTMEQSGFGGTVDVSSHWILRSRDGKEIWSDKVDGTGSSFAFGGVARIRAAHEQAVKDTIINGVEKLSQLSP